MSASGQLWVSVSALLTVMTSLSCSDGTAPSLSAPIESISAGLLHTCALAADGTAHCWGWNRDGQLGDGTVDDRVTAVQVQSDGVTFAAVHTGGGHTCGLADDGSAHCWGFNLNGQLGDGSQTDRLTPVAVTGGLQFAMLSPGTSHTCGVTTGQAAYCWGWNLEGQLGDGSASDQSGPVLVAGGLSFTMVSAGSFHTCGVTTTGDAYCWGRGSSGQLGNGATADATTPVLVDGGHSFATVSVGIEHTCGMTTDQDLRCWGRNTFGQLGVGLEPVDVTRPSIVSGAMKFRAVSGGALFTCGITTADATFCWGLGQNGQLGTDNVETCADPDTGSSVVCALDPRAVQGGLAFGLVSAGNQHTCGIALDAIAYCWGLNSKGQLGNGTSGDTELSVQPVRVAGQM